MIFYQIKLYHLVIKHIFHLCRDFKIYLLGFKQINFEIKLTLNVIKQVVLLKLIFLSNIKKLILYTIICL